MEDKDYQVPDRAQCVRTRALAELPLLPVRAFLIKWDGSLEAEQEAEDNVFWRERSLDAPIFSNHSRRRFVRIKRGVPWWVLRAGGSRSLLPCRLRME